MKKPAELYTIQEPEASIERTIAELNAMSAHGPATPRPVAAPWPRQVAWRDYLASAKR